MGEKTFPRQSRLLKPAEFRYVFKQPVVSSDHLFKVFARRGGLGHHRIGLAVSRKVDKRAVGRNRIKRVIRESFRLAGPERHGLPEQGRDYVIVALPKAASSKNELLRQSLANHWQNIDQRFLPGT